MSAGLSAMRLVRRIGLGLGSFILVYDLPNPYNRLGMALGAALIAFFLPHVAASSFEHKD
jgi:hypothetical protein